MPAFNGKKPEIVRLNQVKNGANRGKRLRVPVATEKTATSFDF
jgi:hypothetical protein